MRLNNFIFIFIIILSFVFTLKSYSSVNEENIPELVPQNSHSGGVTKIAITSDNKFMVTGGEDSALKIWDFENGKLLKTLTGHNNAIVLLKITPDNKFIISKGRDSDRIRIWELTTGKLIKTYASAIGDRDALTVSRDCKYIISAGFRTRDIRVLNLLTGKETLLKEDSELADHCSHITLTRDNKYIITDLGGIFELSTGKLVKNLKGFITDKYFYSMTQDNKYIITIDYSGPNYIKIYEVGTKKLVYKITGTDATISPNNKYIISEDVDKPNEFKIYELSTGKLLRTVKDEFKIISPDDKYIITINDNTIKVYDLFKGNLVKIFKGDSLANNLIEITPNNRFLVSTNFLSTYEYGADNTIKIWDLKEGKLLRTLEGHSTPVKTLAISKNSKYIVTGNTGDKNKSIKIWELNTGKLLNKIKLSDNEEEIDQLIIHDDRILARLVEFDKISKLNVYDLNTAKLLKTIKYNYYCEKMQISSNYKYIVYAFKASYKNWIDVVEMNTNNVISKIEIDHGSIKSVSITSDNKYIVIQSVGQGGSMGIDTAYHSIISVVELTTGNLVNTIDTDFPTEPKGQREVNEVLITPDDKYIVSASFDKTIDIFELKTGKLIKRLKGHSDWINAIGITSDNKFIISGGNDGTIKIWNIKTGEFLCNLMSFDNGKDWLTIKADGLFDGSPEGWQKVSWHFSNDPLYKLYEPEQFLNEYFYPGLLSEILNGKTLKVTSVIEKKDRRLPEVKIISPRGGQNFSNRNVKVTVEVKDIGSGVKDLRLYRNGVMIDRPEHGKLLTSGGKNTANIEFSVPLVAGINTITAYSFNRDNIKSKDAEIVINGDNSLQRPSTAYILAIGINEYKDNSLNLKFAVADAESIIDQFKQKFQDLNNYKNIETTILQDKDATKDGISKAIENLSQIAQPEDILLIYYAGHGYVKGQHFHMIPHDFDSNNFEQTTISDEDLSLLFEKLSPIQQMFIIDACQSGKLLEEGGKGPMNSAGLGQLAWEKGMYILAAAQSQEAALEVDKLGHGLLTYTLTNEGLKGQADTDPKDGKIYAKELFDFTANRVPELQAEAIQQVRKLRNIELTFNTIRGIGGIIKKEDLGNLLPIESRTQTPKVFYRREAGEDLLLSIIK